MEIFKVLRGGILVAVLLLLFLAVRKACSAEGDSLLSLLKRGTRLEFTTKPGGLSFLTFLVLCFLAITFASFGEVLQFLYDLFNVETTDRQFSGSQAMAYAMCALVLNFIFVAWMRGGRRRR